MNENEIYKTLTKEIKNEKQWHSYEFAVTHFEIMIADLTAVLKRIGIETGPLEKSFAAAREVCDDDWYPYETCRELDIDFADRLVDAVNEMAEKWGDDPLSYMDLPL